MPNPYALIIEDEGDLADIFKLALEAAGCDAEIIANGAVAQARLKEITPDLIILDLHLPGVDGETLLRQIREDDRLDHVRVVLATADAVSAEMLGELSELTLLKPISFSQMRDLAIRLMHT